MDFNFIFLFLDSIFLDDKGVFGFLTGGGGRAAMGSADPIVKGIIPTVFAVTEIGRAHV